MPLDVFGTPGQEKQQWSLTGMFRPFFPWRFHQRGSGVSFLLATNFLIFDNRYQIATGAGDDTIRIWDLRSLSSVYTIPAHVSNVADVRFFSANDLYFKQRPSPP